jgi:tRNA threonylcarbamoyladenosine biosynthesis protein TsaE
MEKGEFVSKNAGETIKFAKDFCTEIKPKAEGAMVVGLYGDLGAGKTTFMKGVAEFFGVAETIQSPTFVIEKIYELKKRTFRHLIHIDAYRIEKSNELIYLGWDEIITHNKNIIFIEWPERVSDIMPEHIKIEFEHQNEKENENQRKIQVK